MGNAENNGFTGIGNPAPSDQSPLQQLPNNTPEEPNSNEINYIPICNTLQIALIHNCSELVNPDGTLTPLGQDTVKCTVSGAILLLGATALQIPPQFSIGGLGILAGPTGCGGLVKTDLLNSVGDIKGIVNQISRFIH